MIAALVLALAQVPAAAEAAPRDLPDLVPWEGTLAEGLAEVERLSLADAHDPARTLCARLAAPRPLLAWKERAIRDGGGLGRAVALAEPLLDLLGIEPLAPAERAAVARAQGLVELRAGDLAAAEAALRRAIALAGPGALRLDAAYDLATAALLAGEAARLQIPEVREQLGLAPAPPAPPRPPVPTAPGAAPPAPPDPLQVARAAYLLARERFVERLLAGEPDGDARANSELVIRRLRELDEIERQREEQEQEQQQQQQQQQDPQDPSGESPPDSEPEPDEPQDPGEEPPAPPEQEQPGDPQGDPREIELSEEEVQRLLDRLRQHDERGEELRREILQLRRTKVRKDW